VEFIGKVVLVTGGSRGIGRAIARAFAQDGAAVAVGYAHEAAAAEQVADALRRGGRRALTVRADVAKSGDVDAMIQRVLDEWDRLDVLVNNAGILRRTPLDKVTLSEWDEVLATNLTGALPGASSGLQRKHGRNEAFSAASADSKKRQFVGFGVRAVQIGLQ